MNDAVQLSFDNDEGEDDEGTNKNEDDDINNSREEMAIMVYDHNVNVASQNLVSLIQSISTWRRNLAPSD